MGEAMIRPVTAEDVAELEQILQIFVRTGNRSCQKVGFVDLWAEIWYDDQIEKE